MERETKKILFHYFNTDIGLVSFLACTWCVILLGLSSNIYHSSNICICEELIHLGQYMHEVHYKEIS